MRYGIWKPLPQWVGGTQKWTGRSGTRPRAIVLHRMLGYLEGTDGYFRREFTDYYPYGRFRASVHFGVGLWRGTPTILQWVDTIYSAWGWAASPNDVPTSLAQRVLGDLMYRIQSWPYFASRIDLNRAVIAIEVEGLNYSDPWHPGVTAKVKELIDAIIRVHGPLTILTHQDCSPKLCPGLPALYNALPGYYGKTLGYVPKPEEDVYEWVRRVRYQDPKKMKIPSGVPVYRAPGQARYAISEGSTVNLIGELLPEDLWVFQSRPTGFGLVRKSQAGKISPL
jgi:hypothetical protein